MVFSFCNNETEKHRTYNKNRLYRSSDLSHTSIETSKPAGDKNCLCSVLSGPDTSGMLLRMPARVTIILQKPEPLFLAVHLEATQSWEQLDQLVPAPPLNTSTAIYIQSRETI